MYSQRVVNWILEKEIFVHCLLGEFTETSFKVLEVINLGCPRCLGNLFFNSKRKE